MDNLKSLANEALITIEAIADSAQKRLGERGLTRAATFLGLTCSGKALPGSMESVSQLFHESW